jgi:hypothetical protein
MQSNDAAASDLETLPDELQQFPCHQYIAHAMDVLSIRVTSTLTSSHNNV